MSRPGAGAPFRDRAEAGRRLAALLEGLHPEDPVVVGMARGGIVVAREVARAFQAPLDVVVVRKIAAPDEPEPALGAVGEDGVQVINRTMVDEAGLSPAALDELVEAGRAELSREVELYRAARPPVPVAGRTVLLVDDGLTTGSTAQAAVQIMAGRKAGKVVLAVPVSSHETVVALRAEVDEVVCAETPPLLLALDEWYEDSPEVTDEEVVALLRQAGGLRRLP
jgi:putative phosphoribosyl transferase